MKPNLIIHGAAGRMGRRLLALAVETGEFDLIAAVDRAEHPDIGADAGMAAGIGEINVLLDSVFPATADIVIDFSLPEATERVVDYCRDNNVALVTGTTGLDEGVIEKMAVTAERIAIVQASNMSVGMNVLFSLVGKVANMVGEDYDIEIVEAHHRFKKDSPSGTALTLAENIAKETGRPWPGCLVHGREGKVVPRQAGTIGMHAIRGGDITGEHSVIFSTLGETLKLSHSAHNRDNFVRGALRAAKWLVGRPAGLYSMADVLGL